MAFIGTKLEKLNALKSVKKQLEEAVEENKRGIKEVIVEIYKSDKTITIQELVNLTGYSNNFITNTLKEYNIKIRKYKGIF